MLREIANDVLAHGRRAADRGDLRAASRIFAAGGNVASALVQLERVQDFDADDYNGRPVLAPPTSAAPEPARSHGANDSGTPPALTTSGAAESLPVFEQLHMEPCCPDCGAPTLGNLCARCVGGVL